MARQDFERFKQEIKEWLDGHPEEYDRFVRKSMTNRLSDYTRFLMWA